MKAKWRGMTSGFILESLEKQGESQLIKGRTIPKGQFSGNTGNKKTHWGRSDILDQ